MFDKEKIDLIIKNNWNSESQNSIAWGLNAQNFTTQKGKKWTQASVSYYALNVLNLERKHKEFTKNSIAQKVESVLTPEVKTEKLTEVKELNPLQTAYKNHVEEVNKTALIETAVFEKQGKFFTDSLKIAQIFDKEHKDVLEAIRNCKVSNNFRSAEFSADVYFDNFNRQQPKINLTKKGFSFVAFGFTGEKADEFKEAYIERFEELEKQAQQPKRILTASEMLLEQAKINVEQERALKEVKQELQEVKFTVLNKIDSFEVEVEKRVEAKVKEATKELEAKVDKHNKLNEERIRSAKVKLKQIAIPFASNVNNFSAYEETKVIVITYAQSKGCFKDEEIKPFYTKLYSSMEREYQIPFRENLKIINEGLPKHKSISVIRYFKQIGLEKELYNMACKLYLPKLAQTA